MYTLSGRSCPLNGSGWVWVKGRGYSLGYGRWWGQSRGLVSVLKFLEYICVYGSKVVIIVE